MSGRKRPIARTNNTLCILVDILSVVFGFVLGNALLGRMDELIHPTPQSMFGMLTFLIVNLVMFKGFEMYSVVLFRFKETLITVFLSCTYSMICTFILYLIVFQNVDVWNIILLGALMSFLVLLFWRESLFFYYLCKQNKPKLLIIENIKPDSSRVRRMKYACLDKFQSWYEQLDINDPVAVKCFIASNFDKYDAICLMDSIPMDIRAMIQNAIMEQGKEFFVVPTMYEMSMSHVRLTLFDDVMVFQINPYEISRTSLFVKRAMDILISGVMLLFAAIPMLLVALAIKVTDNGPVFYKQVRLTRGKREFEILKFRSMVVDAEKLSGPTLATKDDPRVTKVGKFIRATRIDELPQLLNILRGDMSMVGPRPERPFFVEKYSKEIKNYDNRFMVKAGLTSLSHVYGKYATDIEDRTLYDLLYLKQFSLLLDLRIMLLTSRIVFLSEAAQGQTLPSDSEHPEDKGFSTPGHAA